MGEELKERDGLKLWVKPRGDFGKNLADCRLPRKLPLVDQSADHGRCHRLGARPNMHLIRNQKRARRACLRIPLAPIAASRSPMTIAPIRPGTWCFSRMGASRRLTLSSGSTASEGRAAAVSAGAFVCANAEPHQMASPRAATASGTSRRLIFIELVTTLRTGAVTSLTGPAVDRSSVKEVSNSPINKAYSTARPNATRRWAGRVKSNHRRHSAAKPQVVSGQWSVETKTKNPMANQQQSRRLEAMAPWDRLTPIFAGGHSLTLRFKSGYFSSVWPTLLLVNLAALAARYSAGQPAWTTHFPLIPKSERHRPWPAAVFLIWLPGGGRCQKPPNISEVSHG